MSSAALPLDVTRPVVRKVARLRRLVRLYVFCEGVAAVVIALGVAYWVALAIDWLIEPSPAARVALWVVAGAAILWTAQRWLFSRLAAPLSDERLALLLERRYGNFRESLITTVEAFGSRRKTPFEASLLQETGRQAAEGVKQASLGRLFQVRPLLRKSLAATLLIASVAGFAVSNPEAFGFWAERMQLSPHRWPRRVQLAVEGFEILDGVLTARVARDDDFEFHALASIIDGHEAPDSVEVRYRLADGRRGRDSMTRVGEALAGRDEAQRYRYAFKTVVDDMTFDLFGGDASIRGLKLQVVARPTVVSVKFACRFPEYLEMAPRSFQAGAREELPVGATVEATVEVNKPLSEVRVHDAATQSDVPVSISSSGGKTFHFRLSDIREDRVLLISVRDVHGIAARQPYRIVVAATPDEPPDVAVRLRGIGAAVTSRATIPIVGAVTDDYGIRRAWIEYQIDGAQAQQRPFSQQPAGRLEVDQFDRFDLATANPETARPLIEVKPGQKLTLQVRAQDAYNLDAPTSDGGGQIGVSQQFLLEIVTPSELRALLERQELALRQRFESIYDKMTGTRELLDRIEPPAASDEAQATTDERERLRIVGARQNTTQLAFETLGVADGFEAIVEELVNNRVATEELKQRLGDGIAAPLTDVAERLMPELETALEALQAAYRQSPAEIAQPLSEAKIRADAVVEAMKQVLDRMLELESYNELVELLRSIVAEQEQLGEQTKAEQRAKLRDLLED